MHIFMRLIFFGGVFPVLIYDNLTSAVQKVLRGKNRIEQESFRRFKSYYSFDARFCNSNCAHEKGGVGGLVGFARRNYMCSLSIWLFVQELTIYPYSTFLAYLWQSLLIYDTQY